MIINEKTPVKKLLLLTLFLFTGELASAQVPLDSFFRQGVRWTSWYIFNAGHYTGYLTVHVNYIDGDTTVNGKQYHLYYYFKKGGKHAVPGGPTYPSVPDSVDTTVKKLVGGIRVDGEQVLLTKIPPDSVVPETLLYDYDLKIGDTLKWKPNANIVIDIDSVQLANGQYEKRFYFSKDPVFPDYWIRGIGSVFASAYSRTYPSFGFDLTRSVCYEHPILGYKFYETSGLDSATVNSCYFIPPLSVGNITNNEFHAEIYPNPATGNNIQLRISADAAEMKVYDVQGRLVVDKDKMSAGTHGITTPASPGIYILVVTFKDGGKSYTRFQKL